MQQCDKVTPEELEILRQQTEEICLRPIRMVSIGGLLFVASISFLVDNYLNLFLCLALAGISNKLIEKGFEKKKEIISDGNIIHCQIEKKEKGFSVHYLLIMPNGKSATVKLPRRLDDLLGSPTVGDVLPFFYRESPLQGAFPVLSRK